VADLLDGHNEWLLLLLLIVVECVLAGWSAAAELRLDRNWSRGWGCRLREKGRGMAVEGHLVVAVQRHRGRVWLGLSELVELRSIVICK